MKLTKKKRVILASFLALVVVGALGLTLFFQITNGQVAEEDGLLQNSRIYLTDISVSDDRNTVYYTIHNDTNHKIRYDYRDVSIEIKKDGKWTSNLIQGCYSRESFASYHIYKAFSDGSTQYDLREGFDHIEELPQITYLQQNFPGEYRVCVPCYYNHVDYYAVGYFTIPEAEP